MIMLEHKYTKEGISWKGLKTKDQTYYRLLSAASKIAEANQLKRNQEKQKENEKEKETEREIKAPGKRAAVKPTKRIAKRKKVIQKEKEKEKEQEQEQEKETEQENNNEVVEVGFDLYLAVVEVREVGCEEYDRSWELSVNLTDWMTEDGMCLDWQYSVDTGSIRSRPCEVDGLEEVEILPPSVLQQTWWDEEEEEETGNEGVREERWYVLSS